MLYICMYAEVCTWTIAAQAEFSHSTESTIKCHIAAGYFCCYESLYNCSIAPVVGDLINEQRTRAFATRCACLWRACFCCNAACIIWHLFHCISVWFVVVVLVKLAPPVATLMPICTDFVVFVVALLIILLLEYLTRIRLLSAHWKTAEFSCMSQSWVAGGMCSPPSAMVR